MTDCGLMTSNHLDIVVSREGKICICKRVSLFVFVASRGSQTKADNYCDCACYMSTVAVAIIAVIPLVVMMTSC